MLVTGPSSLPEKYASVRNATIEICRPLELEDHVVQPAPFVSPLKWHLGHTTWLIEKVLLEEFFDDYPGSSPEYALVFNSYYKTSGPHWRQADRGHLSRPTLQDVMLYRQQVDEAVMQLLSRQDDARLSERLALCLQHEQQHQELMWMDIKYILAVNPSMPAYIEKEPEYEREYRRLPDEWWHHEAGVQEVGFEGGSTEDSFAFDNERPRHRVYLESFDISNFLVSNAQYQAFIEDDGYKRPELWLSRGWDWVQSDNIHAPLYWFQDGEEWRRYTLFGAQTLDPIDAVCHISYFEADAYARWAGARLPTEFETELWLKLGGVGAYARVDKPNVFETHQLWTWTSSAYSAYPGFQPFEGMLSEYNGKFMCGQYVLKEGCWATPTGHHRITYRNYYSPEQRWMYSGIRLARDAMVPQHRGDK